LGAFYGFNCVNDEQRSSKLLFPVIAALIGFEGQQRISDNSKVTLTAAPLLDT
jgi:hypothetical protein